MKDTPETPAHVLDLAVRTEERLHGVIDSFALPGARLYGVNTSDTILADPAPCLLAQHPDVYTLLAEPGSALARSFAAAALVTTGWAAPLDENGQVSCAPSEHEGRRRVRLTVLVTDAGVASVLRFADDPDEVITDPGSATGSLADAIQRFWFEPPRIDAAV
ncbi:MAG: hypothetical protein RL383_1114 [Actinomycetota bacterium]|jgi:hypothetical protein